MFGSTRLLFLKKADAKPSAGGATDHIGFSFANLDAKMKEFEPGVRRVICHANRRLDTSLNACGKILKV